MSRTRNTSTGGGSSNPAAKYLDVNGVAVCVSDEGCITKPHRVTGEVSTYGSNDGRGYRQVRIGERKDGQAIRVHRLVAKAFLPEYSEDMQVDHINGDKSDNRLCNLRMASYSGNRCGYVSPRKNATSKYRGVSWSKGQKGWLSQTKFQGKQYSLGVYDTEEEAAKSYDAMALALGFSEQALNFSAKDATNLLLFALLTHNINTTQG